MIEKFQRFLKLKFIKNPKFDLFKTNFTIKTEERDIQLTNPFETIPKPFYTNTD